MSGSKRKIRKADAIDDDFLGEGNLLIDLEAVERVDGIGESLESATDLSTAIDAEDDSVEVKNVSREEELGPATTQKEHDADGGITSNEKMSSNGHDVDQDTNSSADHGQPESGVISAGEEPEKRVGRTKIYTTPTRSYNVTLSSSEKDDAQLLVNHSLLTSNRAITINDVISERFLQFCKGSEIYGPDHVFPRLIKSVEYRAKLPIETVLVYKEFKRELKESGITHINSIESVFRYLLLEWLSENEKLIRKLKRDRENKKKRKFKFK